MDHKALCDEQPSQPASRLKTCELAHARRPVTGPVATAPPSLARRCDHIIGLIDELLTAPASRSDDEAP